MSVSLWQDRSNNHYSTFDVTIIGGGIAGVSTAYWILQNDPSLKVALVEKYELGSGATGRNAGFITCGSVEHFNRLVEKHGVDEASEIWKFSEQNLDLLKEHIIQNDNNLLFEQKGSFSLAGSDSEMNELKKSAELMKKFGINVDVLDQQNVQQRLGAMDFVGGVKYADDASIHPFRLLNAMADKIDSKRLTIFSNNEVYAVEERGGARLVKTQKHQFETSMVVYATNAYSPLLNDYFKDKIFPTRGQILATAPVEKFMEGPCYANFVLDYFRQLPTGELVIGGFRQLQKDAEVGFSDETTDLIQNALHGFIKKHIPKVANAKITHRWSGIMGFSADGNPMVGSLPNDPQSFFVGGFTAHGLGLAFHSAKVLADLVFDKQIPKFISAKRFH